MRNPHPVTQVAVEAPFLKGLYHTEAVSWRRNSINLVFSTEAFFDTASKRFKPALQWKGYLVKLPTGWLLSADWPKPYQ
jgi:hypothetical protein